MIVYVCYDCSYNGADQWRHLIHIFDNEQKAIDWVCELEATEYDWREYEAEKVK
jgi:hypothetical protein